MSKGFRVQGHAVCDITAWIPAQSEEEAIAILNATPVSELWRVTTVRDIVPQKDTLVIDSIRESTGDNP